MHRKAAMLPLCFFLASAAAAQVASVLSSHAAYSSSRDTRAAENAFIARQVASKGVSQRCAAGEASKEECKMHWAGALRQSLTFLAAQDTGLMSQPDERNRTLHGKWFRQYQRSITADRFTHWSDGDSWFTNDVGHPMQGATVGFIFIENDPRGKTLRISKSRAYWTSRLRAAAWAAAYEVEWELGPAGEAGLGFEGDAWYLSPHTHRWTNGAGLTDFVMSPVGGFGWMVAEDGIDRLFLHRALERTHNPVLKLGLSALNPNRSVSNLMRLKWPWHRDATVAEQE